MLYLNGQLNSNGNIFGGHCYERQFLQNDQLYSNGIYLLVTVMKANSVFFVLDVPSFGLYYFSYEWILNHITVEGERYVEAKN